MAGLLLPSFAFTQQQPLIEAPETLEEAKEMGEKAGQELQEKLPGILEKIWKEEVSPVWQKMWNWAKYQWGSYILPKAECLLQKYFWPEIEKRKPMIEEELEKEKEEIREELPKVGKSLWERFKELIK